MCSYNIRIYSAGACTPQTLAAMVEHVLRQSFYIETQLVRMVWFADTPDNASYETLYKAIDKAMRAIGLRRMPVWTLVAQRPLGTSKISVEVHSVRADKGERIVHKSLGGKRYLLLKGGHRKQLFCSLRSSDTAMHISRQADEVFDTLGAILAAEGMQPSDIMRQWNYVERITDCAPDGCQHYQALNDARSRLYSKSTWQRGYPAATGIGSAAGGIAVDVNAAQGIETVAVDNPLQTAAHAYSVAKLADGTSAQKSTPKFERARIARYSQHEVMYISGTAAIRGENSLADTSIGSQTAATIENIDALLAQGHRDGAKQMQLRAARIYVKNADTAAQAERLCRAAYPTADIVCLEADICRAELQVEIEAIAE